MTRDTPSQQRRRSGSAVSRQSTGPPHTTDPVSYLYISTDRWMCWLFLHFLCYCCCIKPCSVFDLQIFNRLFVVSKNVQENVIFRLRTNYDLALIKEIWSCSTRSDKPNTMQPFNFARNGCGHSIIKWKTQFNLIALASYIFLLLEGVTTVIILSQINTDKIDRNR